MFVYLPKNKKFISNVIKIWELIILLHSKYGMSCIFIIGIVLIIQNNIWDPMYMVRNWFLKNEEMIKIPFIDNFPFVNIKNISLYNY